MSKLLTIFMLLYGICPHTVAPRRNRSDQTRYKVVGSRSANTDSNDHEMVIPFHVKDRYQDDKSNRTKFGSPLVPETGNKNRHDVMKIFNISVYRPSIHKRSTFRNHKASVFVFRGRSVTLPCSRPGKTGFTRSPKHTKFDWLDSQHNAVANSRYSISKKGVLSITNTEPSDSGQYTCKVKDTLSRNIKKSYSIRLAVYILPTFKLYIKVVLPGMSCSMKPKKQPGEELRGVVCPKASQVICRYKITSKCKRLPSQGSSKHGKGKNKLWLTASTGLPSHYQPGNCDALCMTKEIRNFLISEKDIALRKITKTLGVVTENYSIKKRCPAGNTLYKKVMCLPCHRGSYSKVRDKECTLCPKGQYQDEMAMTKCHQCPKGKTTASLGSTGVSDCKGPGEVTLSLSVSSKSIEHYAAIGAVPGIIIIIIITACAVKMSKKKKEKHDLLLGDQHLYPSTRIDDKTHWRDGTYQSRRNMLGR